jgi:hypothetical protein
MTDDMHRKLSELGSSKTPEPDPAFVTGLELELRSMRASSRASGRVQRRWPATVAAVTFSFAVIAFGLATIDTAPASVRISAANGAVVYMPSGAIVPAEPGLELEAGAVVQVGPGGSASISGGDQEIDLGPGDVAEVTAEGIVVPDEAVLDVIALTTVPSTAVRGASSAGVANTTALTTSESVPTAPPTTATSDTTSPNTVSSDTSEPADAEPPDVTITEPGDNTTTTTEMPSTTVATTTIMETPTTLPTTSTVTTATLGSSTTTVGDISTTTTRYGTEPSTSTSSTTHPDDGTASSSSTTTTSTSTTTEPDPTSTTSTTLPPTTTTTTTLVSTTTTTVAQPDLLTGYIFGPQQAVSETCDYDADELLALTRAVSDGLLSLVEAIELLTC